MFFFRINKLKIFDNKEKGNFFKRDLAEVKLISFVNTEMSGFLPNVDKLLREIDKKKQKKLLENVVSQIVNSRILSEIDNVKDNFQMYFGDTGYVLHQSREIPEFFDWLFIAYESDEDIREQGQMVLDIIGDNSFDTFTNNIGTLAGGVNPTFTVATEIIKYVVTIIAKTAKKNKDDLIGVIYTSLNRREHYRNGERKKDDVPDLTNNMLIDYSIFAYDEDKAEALV